MRCPLRRPFFLLPARTRSSMRLACQALRRARGFPPFILLSSDCQDRCVLADLLGIRVEQELALLHPGMRSPRLRPYAAHPGWKHVMPRHEAHERQRMKQATVPRSERVRSQPPEDADQLDCAALVEV